MCSAHPWNADARAVRGTVPVEGGGLVDTRLLCQLRPEILTPAQTVARVAADHAKWGRVVKEANIRAD